MPPKEKEAALEVSARSTKQEILDAYETVLRQLEEKQQVTPQEEQKKIEERTVVDKASQHSVESLIEELGGMKLGILKAMDGLSENLVSQCNQLKQVQQAIAVEQRHLKDLYGIRETAHALSALIRAQEERKTAFEKETEEAKTAWKHRQEALEAEHKQRKEEWEKARKREEEDYQYTLATSRRKERDAYEAKKAELEKELADKRRTVEDDLGQRESALAAREQELETLRASVAEFPDKLLAVKDETAKTITRELESKHRFASEIKAKEIEGESRLSAQKIASLEAKIKEQEQFIAQLTQRANEAGAQVQEIARRALETSSQRYFPANAMANAA